MKPIIGVTPSIEIDGKSYMVSHDHIKAIILAGGIPIILPLYSKTVDIAEITQMIDGLYLTGGYDIDPLLFGEEPHEQLGTITPARDTFEMVCIDQMLTVDKPILGVCRGCQILNIAVGGNMYQDIYAQIDGKVLQHIQKAPQGHKSHFVYVKAGSLLEKLIGMKKFLVNSRHHQANRKVVQGFQVSGKASDGVIESIESTTHTFVLGVQWHPENMATLDDQPSQRIFRGFMKACQHRKTRFPR